jgi:chromate transporter
VARLFLRLGATSFGGPAAHIGIMHHEVVQRRRWLSEGEFLDLVGATNLIPGPNSTEMAIHVGFRRAGWRGLVAGGAGFILPATAIVLALAWAYARFGTKVEAAWLLYGVKPVVIGIIGQALWNLGRKAVKSLPTTLAGGLVLALYFFRVNEILLLFAGGLGVMAAVNFRRTVKPAIGLFLAPLTGSGMPAIGAATFGLPLLFLTFLKIGAVLYGSGYVLFAFLRADLVTRFGWLTDQQLVDAIAVGQVTPGPLFTSATFIGYLLGGLPGALLATLGIFLPSFILVAASNPLIPRLRRSPWAGAFLDGVNAASLGLMAAVSWQLGRASLIDVPTIAMALATFGILMRLKINSAWLVLAGGAIGLISMLLGR